MGTPKNWDLSWSVKVPDLFHPFSKYHFITYPSFVLTRTNRLPALILFTAFFSSTSWHKYMPPSLNTTKNNTENEDHR